MRSTKKGYPEIRVAFSLTKLSMTYPCEYVFYMSANMIS